VWQYGASLIDLVELEPNRDAARILDVGCGSGELTQKLSLQFPTATVHGMDLDANMIRKSQDQYPHLHFFQDDVRHLLGEKTNDKGNLYDVVFSNAALHWVPPRDAAQAVQSLSRCLRPGGQFVAEFGGKGNVQAIEHAVQQAIIEIKGAASGETRAPFEPFWYFPSVGEFASMLEENGIEVQSALLFDRPTVLMEGEKGLSNWIQMFGSKFFEGLDEDQIESILRRAEEILQASLWDGNQWTADYRRIRVVGRKK